jgi:hypothetical protein
MCGRYVSPDIASIERAWHIGRSNSNQLAQRYKVLLRRSLAPGSTGMGR